MLTCEPREGLWPWPESVTDLVGDPPRTRTVASDVIEVRVVDEGDQQRVKLVWE